jgi:dihydroorotate dehydrogenase
LHSFRRLRNFADYVVLNVSSPNTPGLRSLQASEALSVLLESVEEENRSSKPILVKISPDLSAEEIEGVIATCEAHAVSGLIATNTTTDHSAIPPEKNQSGGLSGPPLLEKSTGLLRTITARSSLPVIGCGGISDVESARQKIAAGAKLLQVYTGFIYRGPRLIREIVRQFDSRGGASVQGL